MSDELSEMIRAAARDEAAAAEREFPLTPDARDHFVGRVGRRRAAVGAVLAVGSVAVIGAAAFGLSQVLPSGSNDPGGDPSPSSSLTPSPSASPSLSPSASASPSVTPSSVETEPPPPPAVPGRVTDVIVGPGSPGAVQVEWAMIANATGYRVYRSASPDGPFTPSASALFDTSNGRVTTTIEIDVPYEWISIGFYSSGFLGYAEVVDHQPACFRVAAFNAEGEGRGSAVACANPAASEPSPEPSTTPSP